MTTLHQPVDIDPSYFKQDLVYDDLMIIVYSKYQNFIEPANEKIAYLIKLQCTVEIIGSLLTEIEYLIKEEYKIIISLDIIRKEINAINRQLFMIFKEVKDFYQSLLKLQNENEKIYEAWKSLRESFQLPEKDMFSLSPYEQDILDDTVLVQIPELIKNMSKEEFDVSHAQLFKELFKNELLGASVLKILQLNKIFEYLNRLRSLHCEFSFLLLHLLFKEDPGNPQSFLPNSYLENLQIRLDELAKLVVEKCKMIRQNYLKALTTKQSMIDAFRMKQQFQIQQINNLNSILMLMKDLGEKNDNLIGKLLKTTEMYKSTNEILNRKWPEIIMAAGANFDQPVTMTQSFGLSHLLNRRSAAKYI